MANKNARPAVIGGLPIGDSAAMLSLGMSQPAPATVTNIPTNYQPKMPTHQKHYAPGSVKPISNKRS